MEILYKENQWKDIQLHKDCAYLDIFVDKCVNASLLLSYDGIDHVLPVHIKCEEGSHLTIMMKKDGKAAADFQIEANVQKDATMHMAICDLEPSKTKMDVHILLSEEGASADIKSACIVEEHTSFHMVIEHHVPYTSGTMEHYAVVKEGGSYHMEAVGKIKKGAHGSVSHQTTRVLTMSEKHNSEVIPLLLIDENDVVASHATTLGQPDENQLYYLQTRGLSREQSLGLLSVGYILPIANIFDDEKLNEKLKTEIEMKVGLYA